MIATLQALSEATTDLIAKAQDSVVRIEARRRVPASGLIWSTDGVIVTANHAIQNEEKISVTLSGGSAYAATLIGRDPATDIAVVRIDAPNLAALPLADLVNLKVGMWVLALARPGQSIQATLGVVSGAAEKWRTPFGGMFEVFLRTEVAMHPGFSGGPLLDSQGNLLGMNNSALSRHFNVAAPATALARVTQELLQHGRVRRGYLGIGVQPVDLPIALQQKINQESGLLILSVAPDSPADQHGLLLGDTIISFEGQPVEHMDQLLASLNSDRILQEIKIAIVRGGQLQEVKVIVGENA